MRLSQLACLRMQLHAGGRGPTNSAAEPCFTSACSIMPVKAVIKAASATVPGSHRERRAGGARLLHLDVAGALW